MSAKVRVVRAQEPELLEQLYLGMGTYDGVGHMRLVSAMRKANRISKGSQAGSSISHAALISDNTEVVQLLVRASEQYGQASRADYLYSAAQLAMQALHLIRHASVALFPAYSSWINTLLTI